MNIYPKVLRIETGYGSPQENVIDYKIYANVPRWWRRIEELFRLDIILALRTKAFCAHHDFDLLWAGSEKVGIPLTYTGINKPIIVVTHNIASPIKSILLRWLGTTKLWSGVGYMTNADKYYLLTELGIPNERLFRYESAKLLNYPPSKSVSSGPIMSVGVSKRDYSTLISALEQLPGYETELYISSKFQDVYRGEFKRSIPAWIRFKDYVPIEELVVRYKKARFIITPLKKTTQFSAGVNAILEAMALGKAVIATRTPGTTDFVVDGVTGILVPPEDSYALGDAIRKLWEHPQLAYDMGQAGRKYVEEYHNPEIVNRQITNFLEMVYNDSILN
jgi:glycosyltransferase involved in cell wall biosynthesis